LLAISLAEEKDEEMWKTGGWKEEEYATQDTAKDIRYPCGHCRGNVPELRVA